MRSNNCENNIFVYHLVSWHLLSACIDNSTITNTMSDSRTKDKFFESVFFL